MVLVSPNKTIASLDELENAQKLFGATSEKVARFENVPLLMKEVESGGLDTTISDSAVIEHYVKNNGNKGFKTLTIPDFAVENYGLVVRKGDTQTLALLNSSLRKIRENGKYDEIKSKYFANK